MEDTLARFVHALRSADVVVTPAETLDAMAVMDRVGVCDKTLLKDALALTLAKSVPDKIRFERCFEQFFSQFAFEEAPKQTLLDSFAHAQFLAEIENRLQPETLELVQLVLSKQRTVLALHVQQIAEDAGIESMQALRDKTRVIEQLNRALGVAELTSLQGQLQGDHATAAAYVRRYVTTQVKQYVDLQYELVADLSGRRAVLEAALNSNIRHIPAAYEAELERAVDALAEQLRYQYKRRRRRQHRGDLDIRRMLRGSMAYDGHLFRLAWRARRKVQGTVFVLCDVSGSVARLSRFLLLFLHKLSEVLPDVRSFAFSNRLGEITPLLEVQDAARAVEQAIFEWGGGTTDYGRAMLDFRTLAGTALDNKSTVIVLGDARGNFYDPRADVLKDIAGRARRLIWLNPETRSGWGEGDSEMLRYLPFCGEVERLATLADLRAVAERLIAARR